MRTIGGAPSQTNRIQDKRREFSNQHNELNKMLDREARTPCVFSNFVFHLFKYPKGRGKS